MSYCTWNGLGQALTEEKISGALESLKREDIKGWFDSLFLLHSTNSEKS